MPHFVPRGSGSWGYPYPVEHYPDNSSTVADIFEWIPFYQLKVGKFAFFNTAEFLIDPEKPGILQGCGGDNIFIADPRL